MVVTREAAYFTDTQAPFLYSVALGRPVSPRRSALGFRSRHVQDDGIAATRNGKHLCIVNGATAQLHLLDTVTHTPIPVDLGGDTLPNADGLWLDGKTCSRPELPQPDRRRRAVTGLLSGAIVRLHTEPFTSNPPPRCRPPRGVWQCALRRDGRLRRARSRFRGPTDEVCARIPPPPRLPNVA